jgi:hypothetical protein
MFSHELVHRAAKLLDKTSIKLEKSPPVGLTTLKRLVELTVAELDNASAALYILSYWFLLRVPSEALAVRFGDTGTPYGQRTGKTIYWDDGEGGQGIRFESDRRKNKNDPTDMRRVCHCKTDKDVCPVHALESYIKHEASDRVPFRHLNARFVNVTLRRRMLLLQVEKHTLYTSKCFRRGHTQDIADRGGTLFEIVTAGQWNSIAFKFYLDNAKLMDRLANSRAQQSPEDSPSERSEDSD